MSKVKKKKLNKIKIKIGPPIRLGYTAGNPKFSGPISVGSVVCLYRKCGAFSVFFHGTHGTRFL